MNRLSRGLLQGSALLALFLLAGSCAAFSQAVAPPAESAGQADTDARIAALDRSLQETRTELTETRAEIRQLRSLLEEMNKRFAASASAKETIPSAPTQEPPASALTPSGEQPASSQPAAHISEDDWQVLNAKVDQQAQEKVESGSKYRVKLWGLALFNAFGVSGRVDDLDVPTLALQRAPGESAGSLGASIRQSTFGLSGVGPDLLGARTSADLQMDFFGGLPSGYGAGSSGIVRLRLARIRFDWDHTSVVGGLDTPFFSPNTPTSFMSLAVPAFASAGNLWTWSPTIRVEQRFDTSFSQFKIEAGLMTPAGYATSGQAVRRPSPGESSRQPVYAVRFSANGSRGDRPASVGISGLYFPQRYSSGVTASGWGSVLDWRFPLFPHTELSGEFFTGKGLDAFGGVPVPFVQAPNYNEYIQTAAPLLAEITMLGGWSQFKVVIDSRNEFNFAAGAGGRDSGALARAATLAPSLDYLSPRNQMMFVNYIFRPRSDLLFSAEYRRIRTYPLSGAPAIASQFGLAAGFLF